MRRTNPAPGAAFANEFAMVIENSSTLDIAVGLKLAMQVPGIDIKLMSSLIGFLKNRYVIIQLPGAQEVSRETVYQNLYQDNAATVRYLHLGKVMGFSSKIIKYQTSPFPLLFLTYPDRIETYNLRKHERISCLFPVEAIANQTRYPGMITDLSAEGCGALLQLGKKDCPFRIDDLVELDCSMFSTGEQETLPSVVKRLSTNEGRVELGLKFRDLHPASRQKVISYVNSAIAYINF